MIAPFDSQPALSFVRLHVWPYMSDLNGVRAMCVNSATVQHFSQFPMREPFTARPLNPTPLEADANRLCVARWRWRKGQPTKPVVPRSAVRCIPHILWVWMVALADIAPDLPRLQHLTALDMCLSQSPDTNNNIAIDGLLPHTLTHLSLCQPAQPYTHATLPPNLTSLHIGPSRDWDYGQVSHSPGPGMLPPTLRTFQWNVSASFERDVLPYGLTILHFGELYDQPLVRGSLPDTLTTLELGKELTRPIPPDFIPASLTHLTVRSWQLDQPLDGIFPPNSQLTTLLLWAGVCNYPLTRSSLPASLTDLDLSGLVRFNRPLGGGCLPASLTRLVFNDAFKQRLLPGHLPAALRILYLPYTYKQRLVVGALPPSLTHLSLGGEYNHPVTASGVLPSGLQLLVVGGERFNQPFHDIAALPPSLLAISRAPSLLLSGHQWGARPEWGADAALLRLHLSTLDVSQEVREELEARFTSHHCDICSLPEADEARRPLHL